MFKNRAVNVSLVNTKPNPNAPAAAEATAIKLIDKISKKAVVQTAAGALAAYAAVVTINTLSSIAENRFSK